MFFDDGFTPWENLESFFSAIDHKPTIVCEKGNDQIISQLKLNHSHNHAGHHASFDKLNLDGHHASLDLDQESLNLDRHHDGLNLGLENHFLYEPNLSHTNQNSPNFYNKLSPENAQSPTSVLLSPSSGSDGFDDSNQNQHGSNLNSYPDHEPTQVEITEEKKRKRMESNRESARRSRMRKQQHIENLTNDANQLKIQTRERSNQLRLMTHHIQLVRKENDRLKAESIILQRKLYQLGQIWQQQQQRSYQQQRHHIHPFSSSTLSSVATQIII